MNKEVGTGLATGFAIGYSFWLGGTVASGTRLWMMANPSAVATLGELAGGAAGVTGIVRYGPLNPGPLAPAIASTFRSSTYTARVLQTDTILYRVISQNGDPTGRYWTMTRPQGPLQAVIDSAIDQNWGNSATRVVTANVPAGTTIYEGAAAAQRGLVGGGAQVYIPKVDPSWIVNP